MVVVIELGNFTLRAMEGLGSDLAASVRAAVKHYSRRLESTRKPLVVPTYLRADAAPDGKPFNVSIGPAAEAALKREADRQHVTPQQILCHAILIYLADMDRDGLSPPLVDPPPM